MLIMIKEAITGTLLRAELKRYIDTGNNFDEGAITRYKWRFGLGGRKRHVGDS
jgi:hypothetical protein